MKINGLKPGIPFNEIGKKEIGHGFKTGFDELLKAKTKKGEPIHFSKHAAQRLEERNIELKTEDTEKLADAIEMANSKGIKNALVISDRVVYVVHVQSRTIVTAVDKESMKDKVFTNVDGAVNI